MLRGERWRAGGDLRTAATRLANVGVWVVGLILLFQALAFHRDEFGCDAHAYWFTGRHPHDLYDTLAITDRYLYSPAFAQLIAPATHLPWPLFQTLWMLAEVGAFAWLLGPLGWRWAVPLLLWCTAEVAIGNILGFVGVALVLGLARPWAWPVLFLTKPPYAVGLLWHVARSQWRHLGMVAAAGGLVVAVSFCWEPGLWGDWFRFLTAMSVGKGHAGGTLVVRLPVAVALAVYAGRSGRAWLLPVCLLLATPVFSGTPSLSILAAVPRLLMTAGLSERGPRPTREPVAAAEETERLSWRRTKRAG